MIYVVCYDIIAILIWLSDLIIEEAWNFSKQYRKQLLQGFVSLLEQPPAKHPWSLHVQLYIVHGIEEIGA